MSMNLGVLAIAAKKAEKLISNNSPVILTAAGVTGVLTTAYFAVKATLQARDLVEEEVLDRKDAVGYDENGDCKERVPYPTNREIVELTWKCYIPTALSAAMTITAIIAANRIGTKRAMAMASAYSISERAFTEYKERVKEKMGERKEQAVRDEIIQEQVNRTPLPKDILVMAEGDVLCFDVRSQRYFRSNMEKVKRAENQFNHDLLHSSHASLTELYILLGLDPTGESDDVGWSSDSLIELKPSSGLAENGKPYLAFEMYPTPRTRYDRVY